ncbi:MAG: FecR domain-containing protein [Polyangiales bacterium]
MSERTPLVQAARDVLAEEPAPLPLPSESESAAIVAAIAAEISRTRRRRVIARAAVLSSVAASVALAFFALRGRPAPRAPVPEPSVPSALAAGHRLVVPADGHGELALPSGSRIEAFAKTELQVSSLGATQSFSLDAGEARFHVKKLAGGERFLVHTADAEIEVRGTVFTVGIVEGDAVCGSRTKIDVVEGVVDVRHDGSTTSLVAGSHFPLCATPPALSPSASATVAAAPSSNIAAQNQLFAAGIDAKKRGDKAGAIAAFDAYLARYPRGFLAESAEVERMRLATGPQRAAAAKAYLAHHPQGFARAEAKAIVDAP